MSPAGLDPECHLALLVGGKYQPGPFSLASAKWRGASRHGWARGMPGLLCSLASCTASPPAWLRAFHVQPWHWEVRGAPSKMFRKFVWSHFLMGWGGCIQATGCWENWRWLPDTQLFGYRPVKYKRALSPPGGGKGGALGNAVATLVTLTECLFLLCPSASWHGEAGRSGGRVLSPAARIATRSKGEGGEAEECRR